MEKSIKFWNITFCSVFVILCVLSIICVMNMNPAKLDRNTAFAESKEALVIDDFEEDTIMNALGNKANVYVKAPSRIMITRTNDKRKDTAARVLLIKYDKANQGGPYDMGGWCGYYTLLKSDREDTYFDATNYKYISFWVRGDAGGENFTIGLADRHWDKVGDSLKSSPVITYIPDGKISKEWTYVRIPLGEFFLDYSQLASITVNFEGECFPEKKGAGTVYIDDIMLEK